LDKQQAQTLGIPGADSRWQDNTSWWGALPAKGLPVSGVAEFTVFLREYVMGQSDWSYELSIPGPPKQVVPGATTTRSYQVPGGLVINLVKEIVGHSGLALEVKFVPNHGLDESAVASAQFFLKR